MDRQFFLQLRKLNIPSLHILSVRNMKGYVVKKDSTINEWKELYLVLNNLSVCLYLNDTCVDLCVGYDLDKNSFVHCIPQYENQSYLVKLDLISFHGDIDSVYFSLDSSKNQAEWFKAIAESILDSLQLLSLRDIWSIDFQPIAKIHSSYPTNRLSDRTVVLFSAASNRPKVVVLSRSDSGAARLYSLLLVNTDHSSLKESSKDGEKTCTYLNWAVMNATRGDVSTGYEVGVMQIIAVILHSLGIHRRWRVTRSSSLLVRASWVAIIFFCLDTKMPSPPPSPPLFGPWPRDESTSPSPSGLPVWVRLAPLLLRGLMSNGRKNSQERQNKLPTEV